MLELLKHYSVDEIIMFLVLLALAFKGAISFWEWLYGWIKSKFDKGYDKQEKEQEILDMLNKHENQIGDCKECLEKILKTMNILIDSDKDDIKSWIVEKHHHFCYEVKAIDYYSLESIERRYAHYKEENGNSYVATLIEELQALPKIENEYIKNTMANEENRH